MGSICISSEDELSQRFESYSLSADVSESESSTSDFSCRHEAPAAASTSLTSSSPPSGPDFADIFVCQHQPPIPFLFPAVGGRHVVIPATKAEKPETKLSGQYALLWKCLQFFRVTIVMQNLTLSGSY